jgi:hypothetical protein
MALRIERTGSCTRRGHQRAGSLLSHRRRSIIAPSRLAIGVLGALRDGIRALRPGRSVRLAMPATNVNVLRAVAD